MRKLLYILTAVIMVVACGQRQSNNTECSIDLADDSVTATVDQEQSAILAYTPKYKNVKEALDACNADSFTIIFHYIIIDIKPDECRIYPSIGDTRLYINPFPFVEYLVEDQNGNSPFVILTDIGRYPDDEIDYVGFHIIKYKNGDENSKWMTISDTVFHYVQTFTPNFEKFYKLLENYEANYLIQKRYYEENHKFIED